MPITLRELAQAAGVSASTVSRVINDSSHSVNDETRAKILSLAKELDYRPNLIARGLKIQRTRTIGIIADSIATPFTPYIIRGLQDHLKANGYFSIVVNADADPSEETRAIHELISRSIDGIVFVESGLRTDSPPFDLANKPYVFVHRLFGNFHPNSVMIDDRYGAHLGVSHLIQQGHRRIAFINGPSGWYPSEHRLLGYQDALAELPMSFDPQLAKEGDWEVQGGYRALKELLVLPHPPTAIFAGNDLMALGAIYALEEAGLRVPEDIAVVGYDDREIANLSRPRITTVKMPCYEMGKAGARMLLELLENPTKVVQSVYIKGELIVRESCGAHKGKISFGEYYSETTPPQLRRRGQPGDTSND